MKKRFNKIICFKGDTLIQTPNGTKSIKNIVPGDIVFSFNIAQDRIETSLVKRVANSKHQEICKIYFNDESVLEMTLDHPIWVIGKGWSSIVNNEYYSIGIEKLTIGDKCLSFNQEHKKIIDIEIIKGDFTMYNISGGINNTS